MQTSRHRCAAVVLGALALIVSACGGDDDDYKNEERPPAPILVSAAITDESISLSPRRFGAGPVTLIVTNQTGSDQKLKLETDEIGGDAPGIEQETGPISPGETASLKADLRQGTYRVAVNGRGIDEAALDVGEPRESAQNQLLQP